MISNFYNFVWSKIFKQGQPNTTGIKRSAPEEQEDNEKFPPRKMAKLDTMDSKELFRGLQNSDMKGLPKTKHHLSKENYGDDDECHVVAEVSSKWGTGLTTGRRALRRPAAESTPAVGRNSDITILKHRQPLIQTQTRSSNDNDVEIVKCVRNISIQKTNQLLKPRSMGEKIFGPFRSTRSKIMKPKVVLQSSNAIARKWKGHADETFRLSEKYEYMKLIQSHTSVLLASGNRNADINRRAIKPAIPVIDLEKQPVSVNRDIEVIPKTRSSTLFKELDTDVVVVEDKRDKVARVNSLQDMMKGIPLLSEDYVKDLLSRHTEITNEKRRQASIEEMKLKMLSEENRKKFNESMEDRMRSYMKLTDVVELVEPEDEVAYEIRDLTEDELNVVEKSLKPTPADEILIQKFDIPIRRRDIATLKGLSWLNDEVINFYMNLLIERGKQENMPKVYAFSTFFYTNLINRGYQGLRRWTKKVDIFSHDLILVPVHLGMHWCLAVVDFKSKAIRYYDSMNSPNNRCLEALLGYLESESMDKRNTKFDTSGWALVNVENIPQQMNGSDCGMFACTFAEHIARGAPLSFGQEHMVYFRKKVILEIVTGKLIT